MTFASHVQYLFNLFFFYYFFFLLNFFFLGGGTILFMEIVALSTVSNETSFMEFGYF